MGKGTKRRSERTREGAPPVSGLSFGERLKFYMDLIEWNQNKLAKEIGMNRAAVNMWCADTRSPSRENVIEVATKIASEIKALKGNEKTVRPAHFSGYDLGMILFDLLASADFHVGVEYDEAAWDASIPLRVGWLNLPPLASNNANQRLALDIARTVVRLMRVDFEDDSSAQDWHQLTSKLKNRQIDVIAPILATSPHRLREIAFSESIGLMIRHVCLIPACRVDEVHEVNHERRAQPDKLNVIRMADGVGDVLAELLGHDGASSKELNTTNVDEAIREIQAAPGRPGQDRIPGVIIASSQAEEFKVKNKNKGPLEWVRLPVEHDIASPLAFGVRPTARRLLMAINTAVSAMKRCGMMAALVEKYANLLGYPNIDELLVEGDVACELPNVKSWKNLNATKHTPRISGGQSYESEHG